MKSNFKNISDQVIKQTVKAFSIAAIVAASTAPTDALAEYKILDLSKEKILSKLDDVGNDSMKSIEKTNNGEKKIILVGSKNFLKDDHYHPLLIEIRRQPEAYKMFQQSNPFLKEATLSQHLIDENLCQIYADISQMAALASEETLDHLPFRQFVHYILLHEGSHCIDPVIKSTNLKLSGVADFVVKQLTKFTQWDETQQQKISKNLTEHWKKNPEDLVLMLETFADVHALGLAAKKYDQKEWNELSSAIQAWRSVDENNHSTQNGISVIRQIDFQELNDTTPTQMFNFSSFVASKTVVEKVLPAIQINTPALPKFK